MSALACNLQTAGLNEQQELSKAAFKQVYSWIISPALWAQNLTHGLWFQKLIDLHCRHPSCYEPDYYWERRPGCNDPWLTRHVDARSHDVWGSYLDTSYMWTKSVSSKSSDATLAVGGHFAHGVFLQPDSKRLKLTSQ